MKTPTTIHQAMMADIIANPSDLSLRLMYADYLCDSGIEDYGEFIQLSIKDGRCYPFSEREIRQWFGPSLPEFHNTELIAQQEIWRVVLKDKLNAIMTIELSNGFIEGFQGTLQAFRYHGPRLCQNQPVVMVKITNRQANDVNDDDFYYYGSVNPPETQNDRSHFIPHKMMGIAASDELNGRSRKELDALLSDRLLIWARSQPIAD